MYFMEKSFLGVASSRRCGKWPGVILFVFLLMATVRISNAMELHRDDDLVIRWDNTLKYSAGYRVANQKNSLIDDPNFDDGDRNFDGFTSNRFDILSEMDVMYKNFGFRVSGSGWVDSMYLSDNDNNSPATYNGVDDHDEFDDAAETMHGLNAELLDSFVFGKFKMGKMPVKFRLGRHTLVWGETLFFGANGIAYAQAPLDFVKALGVPGSQFKEIMMPVNQASGQIQLSDKISFEGYWQFEWRRTRVPAAGSYFANADFGGPGGRKLLLDRNPPDGSGIHFARGDDMGGGDWESEFGEPDHSQFGVALKYRVEALDTDFGFYFIRYNEKMPYWAYIEPYAVPVMGAHGLEAGKYCIVFPKKIKMVGASFGTQIGEFNVSGEVTTRFDAPLLADPSKMVIPPGMSFDNDDHPLYPTGDTFHANLSTIYLMKGSKLWDGGTIMAEVGYTDLLGSADDPYDTFDESRKDWALGLRMILEPAYYQVMPGLDLRVPIGCGYSPEGRSPGDLSFNMGGAHEGGDFSIGVNLDYLYVWKASLKYTNYFGSANHQGLADRDFISLSLQRTF
ncbi:MAG: DUF1302 domain-containing protein [Dissulfuribacterales bacterium]